LRPAENFKKQLGFTRRPSSSNLLTGRLSITLEYLAKCLDNLNRPASSLSALFPRIPVKTQFALIYVPLFGKGAFTKKILTDTEK